MKKRPGRQRMRVAVHLQGDGPDCAHPCSESDDRMLALYLGPAGDCAHCLGLRYPLSADGAFSSMACNRCGRLWQITEVGREETLARIDGTSSTS